MTDAWLFHTNQKHFFENKNYLAFSTSAPSWSSSRIFSSIYACASTFLLGQVWVPFSPFPWSTLLTVAQLEHGANSTKAVGSIPPWAIHLRTGLGDSCESLSNKNILWSGHFVNCTPEHTDRANMFGTQSNISATSSGILSIRRTDWRRTPRGLEGWSTSPMRKAWESWGCSAWEDWGDFLAPPSHWRGL